MAFFFRCCATSLKIAGQVFSAEFSRLGGQALAELLVAIVNHARQIFALLFQYSPQVMRFAADLLFKLNAPRFNLFRQLLELLRVLLALVLSRLALIP